MFQFTKSRISLFAATTFLSLGSLATADIVYDFDQTNYNIAAGESVDVQIFLTQIGSTTDDPVDLNVDDLFSGGVRVFFDDNAPANPAEVLSITDIVPNPSFDDTFVGETIDLVPGQSAGFTDAVDDFDLPLIGDRILLGTLRFTAGDTIGEVTNLRAERFDPVFDNTIANDISGTPLDGLARSGSATITVTSVPEPSSLSLLGAIGFGILLRRRKK